MKFCASIAFAERTALREEVFQLERALSLEEALGRARLRARQLVGRFWTGVWTYSAPENLASAEEDGLRYIQFSWKTVAEYCAQQGDGPPTEQSSARDLALDLAADCIALRAALTNPTEGALPPKALWEIVKAGRDGARASLLATIAHPDGSVQLSPAAGINADDVAFYRAVVLEAGAEMEADDARAAARTRLNTLRGDDAEGPGQIGPEGDVQRADLLVRADRLVEALALLGARIDKPALSRRLVIDRALRTDWSDYGAFLDRVSEPDLASFVELLRSTEGPSDATALDLVRDGVSLIDLPFAYQGALERGQKRQTHSPQEALVLWRAARGAVGERLSGDVGDERAGVVFCLEANDRLPEVWTRHVQTLHDHGVAVAALTPSASVYPGDLLPSVVTRIETVADLAGFRALAPAGVMIARGPQFLAADATWLWKVVLKDSDARAIETLYLPARPATPAAIQYAYSTDLPTAGLVAFGAPFDGERFLENPLAFDLLFRGEIDARVTTVGLTTPPPITDVRPLVVVYDGSVPPDPAYDGPILLAPLGAGTEAGEGLADALAGLPAGTPDQAPVLFLSQDMLYPANYVRNAVAAFDDHEGRFDLSFLPLRRSIQAKACVPMERNTPGLTSLSCLASMCLPLERARALGQVDRLSTLLETTQPSFVLEPLFDPPFVSANGSKIARYLAVEAEDGTVPIEPRSPVTEADLAGLGEASRRILAAVIRRRTYIRKIADEVEGDDFEVLTGRTLAAAIGLCREVAQTGYLSSARRLNDRILLTCGRELAKAPELSMLLDLTADLGRQATFAQAHRRLFPLVLNEQPTMVGRFADLVAAAVDPTELELMLMSGVAALRDDRRERPMMRLLEVVRKYASASFIGWVLEDIVRRVRSETLAKSSVRSGLRGLLALSDIPLEMAEGWGLPAEVMLALKAEAPQRRLRAALTEGDVDQLAQLINSWIAEDRPLLDLARELRSYSHELGQMALPQKISAYRLYDTPDARLTFAGIISDKDYLESNLSTSAETDADVIGRARLGRLDWLEERLQALGAPLGLTTPRFETGDLVSFLASAADAAEKTPVRQSELPRVSVVMTVLDPDPQLLELAISSILNQQGVEPELVLIDDGSEPDAADMIARLAAQPGVIYERSSVNQGPYLGRNRALELATAPYFAIQDGDDVAHPARLRTQVDALEAAGAEAMLSTTWHLRIDGGGKPQFEQDFGLLGDGTMTSIFRREVFERVGPFARVRSRGDVEMRERIRATFGEAAIVHVDYPLVYCNAAPTTLSNRTASTSPQYLSLFRANFARYHRHLRQARAVGEVITPPDSAVPLPLRP
ncbi:glycosyltransferase family A protein [Brevundimonas sp.]|uniref:glycosyltransferase family 2 protein n=1 Tax=Brevundimonas sp. TaxID=1871086 RepID=UPI0028AFE53B|nr:glycosyltransferase family A protein [Brevundimonas sp.]